MRFLFATTAGPTFGGPHNQALRLAEPLRHRGWDTMVLLPWEQGNAASRLRAADIPVAELPLHRLESRTNPLVQARFLRAIPAEVQAIRRLIRRQQVDLVVVGGHFNPQAALAGRLERIPVVWQLLDTYPPLALRTLLMPMVRVLADVVMSTGLGVAKVHPGAVAFGKRLIPFFPPVDGRAFEPADRHRLAAREALGIDPGLQVVGTVGNIAPMKGHRLFLKAAATLRAGHPDVRFVILGALASANRNYGEDLWKRARALGLTPGQDLIVRDPGAAVNILAQAFDVFWLTSEPRSEGIPTVVEEAMALCLPVVTVDVGAVREAVVDGVTGFLVNSRDPSTIAACTARLLSCNALRAQMSAAARCRALELFDVNRCADMHLTAFDVARQSCRWGR